MNQYDLTGRVAVITGGAQGIGLAVARRMAASGAVIAIWDLDGVWRLEPVTGGILNFTYLPLNQTRSLRTGD